ncbi:hypothetical protein ACI3L1_07700 [Deinococcus sp. SM5_A1]|uniref:hypothetical protein n=1 Tax=Deinococcus sp. SM5_A1 TaxID=3379094 RepID=UPI00385A3A38
MKLAHTLTLCLALSAPALAQQKPPVPTFSPVTIDGVTTPAGLVTVSGKTYVSLDALKARGLTVLAPNSLGLYRYPKTGAPALKLTGCRNEWLDNGVVRLKLTDIQVTPEAWQLKIDVQASTPATAGYLEDLIDFTRLFAVTEQGRTVDPATSGQYKAGLSQQVMVSPGRTEAGQGLVIQDANGTGGERLARLTLVPKKDGKTQSVMNVDLTCQR